MKNQELLLEPTLEALEDDEWKLFVPQATLNELEIKHHSDLMKLSHEECATNLLRQVQSH